MQDQIRNELCELLTQITEKANVDLVCVDKGEFGIIDVVVRDRETGNMSEPIYTIGDNDTDLEEEWEDDFTYKLRIEEQYMRIRIEATFVNDSYRDANELTIDKVQHVKFNDNGEYEMHSNKMIPELRDFIDMHQDNLMKCKSEFDNEDFKVVFKDWSVPTIILKKNEVFEWYGDSSLCNYIKKLIITQLDKE